MSRQPEAIPRKNFAVGETSSSSSIAADRWPLMISLAHHVKQLSIPKAYFDELIKGVEMDL